MANYMNEVLSGRMSVDEAYVKVCNLLAKEYERGNVNTAEVRALYVQSQHLAGMCAHNYIKEHGWVQNPVHDEFIEYVRSE